MKKLGKLVRQYKDGDNDALIEIIDVFKPVINKYSRNSYNEDMENELVLFMITLLDKMPVREEVLNNDKYVFLYILKSLKNKYIYINKKSYERYSNELLNNEYLNYHDYESLESDIVFYDMIKFLSDVEKNILIKKYIGNLSESDIARKFNTSRQYINRTHKKALNKLRKMYN